jgi:hypothetical protein
LLGGRRGNWQTADRSSAGLLPNASEHPDALIREFAARTVRWRGIFAVHTWIVVKERGASRYSRYDCTAWGEPIRVDGFAPDGRWFGAVPETVVSVDGEEAEKLIPKIRSVIENYKFRAYGDYSPWPGPNSNTFVQAVLDAMPELKAVLPPTAIGKDYPLSRRLVWCDGITDRLVRLARRLLRTDNRLDRGDRTKLYGRCPRARHPSSCAEATSDRPIGLSETAFVKVALQQTDARDV